MYTVKIKNGTSTPHEIHGQNYKLQSGSVVQGINTIDSFSFTVLPGNPGFGALHDFTTLVTVFNEAKNRYEFQGRVLCSSPSMNESGLITQEVTCESYFGFLCDSQQIYVEEQNWTGQELLNRIINVHNSQVEEYKRFKIGSLEIDLSDASLYEGIQRENTWETIKKKLIEKIGGEIRFRVEDDGLYIDYLKTIGTKKTTEIALSRNMKSIVKEKDPSSFITRLIPLGAKLYDDSEERVDITTVNDGINYIDDIQAINEYGLHVGYVEFDDVTEPINLLTKARAWLKENNKVLVKYSITALDLSLIGKDIDDFEVHNYYPVKNKLLGIDDVSRITKKTINICDDTKTTIEIGESFKTLSEIQREQYANLGKINADIKIIKRDFVTNEALTNKLKTVTTSIIEQSEEQILLKVGAGYVSNTNFNTYKEETAAELSLKVGKDDKDQIVSMLKASAKNIDIKSNRLTITSDYFTLSADGKIKATDGEFSGAITSNDVKITGGSLLIASQDGGFSGVDKDGIYSYDSTGKGMMIQNGSFHAFSDATNKNSLAARFLQVGYDNSLNGVGAKLLLRELLVGYGGNDASASFKKAVNGWVNIAYRYLYFVNGICVHASTEAPSGDVTWLIK